MNRRGFLKALAIAGGASSLPFVAPSLYAQSAPQTKFLINLQLEGGMDVTSFCDPKVNVAGEREINRWARTAGVQTAGNINYAPFANNAQFFQKYYRDMLVINGVDSQTNSHSVGIVNNWSGRTPKAIHL